MVDDERVKKMRTAGKSLSKIAEKMGVTRGAIQASLRRLDHKEPF